MKKYGGWLTIAGNAMLVGIIAAHVNFPELMLIAVAIGISTAGIFFYVNHEVRKIQ